MRPRSNGRSSRSTLGELTRLSLLVLLSCAAPQPAPLEKPAPWPPLPAAPQGRLPHTFEPTSYAAHLDIDPDRPGFSGTITITGELTDATPVIWLHAEGLVIDNAHAERGGKRIELRGVVPSEGLLALGARQPLVRGRWTIVVSYRGLWNSTAPEGAFKEVVNTFTPARYVATMFEPDYARRVFPCIDEPDRKVPWQLTLDVPRNLVAASNMPIARETMNARTKRVEFAPTPPLPSYLVAFAVGPFEVVEAGNTKTGIPVRVLALRNSANDVAIIAPQIAPLIDRLADWLAVPFPYPKLDVVALPWTAPWWGAMENPGLITIFNKLLTTEGRSIIAHELAHHWFGDLVTPAWWDDIWLNEGFAYWIGNKIDHLDTPEPFDWRISGFGSSIAAPVARPRDVIGGSSQLTGRLALDWYRGARLLDLIQRYLGAERFRAALRAYLTAHAHGTVRSADLARAFGDANGEDFAALLDGYLHDTGPDGVTMQLRCANGRSTVELPASGRARLACFAFDLDGKRAERCVRTSEQPTSIDLGTHRCSQWLFATSTQLDLDAPKLQALLDHAWPQLTEHERVSLAFVVIGNPALRRMRWIVLERLASSNDIETISWVASYLRSLEKYFADDLRPKYDAWVRRLFGTRARAIGYREPHHESAVVDLVARTGDPVLLAEARKIIEKPALPRGGYGALVALVRHDTRVAETTFAKALTGDMAMTYAASGAPSLLDLVGKHHDSVRALKAHVKTALFGELCDATQRATLANLAPQLDLNKTDFVLEHVDDCIDERKKLDPELREFFLKAH